MSHHQFRQVATCMLHTESRLIYPADSELLARFSENRDENAFAELVARHGGLVLGTARRCLRDSHTSEDVYQATFMTLARKAGGIKWMASIGPWLHATTVRLARKVLSRATPTPIPVPTDVSSRAIDPAIAVGWDEICRILNEELATLPEKLRVPLVLCYLQSFTRDEAAQAIDCSLAMVKRRLERGRRLLSDRLMRRGVTLPAAGLGMLACELTVRAMAIEATTRAAVAFATQGIASPTTAMLLNCTQGSFKLKMIAVAAAVAGMLVCGIAFATFSQSTGGQTSTASQPPIIPPKVEETAINNETSEALPPGAIARLGSVRLRSGDNVSRMAFSPDGTKLASFSQSYQANNTLTIWDTKTGRALRQVEMSGGIGLLVWLADGRGIALVYPSDSGPYLWEFTDEKAEKPRIVPRQTGSGTIKSAAIPNVIQDNEHDACYAISSDGKILAIGRAGQLESDREVQFWELKTGVKVDTLKPLKGGVIHPGNCGIIHFTPDAKTLVVITKAKHLGMNKYEGEQLVTVWDVATSKQKTSFKAPRPAANGVKTAVAVSNAILAIGLVNGDTSLWDLSTGKERQFATGHKGKKPEDGRSTYSVAFTPDGKRLATGGMDNLAKLWDVASGRLLHTFGRHWTWVETLEFDRSGKLLASAGQAGLIHLWDTANGADACPLAGHKSPVWNVELSPDGKFAYTLGRDETLRWWDVGKSVELRSVPASAWRDMNLSPDGKTILVGREGKFQVWDAATGRETTPANLPDDVKFEHCTFTPDGKKLIAAAGPKVTIWEWPAMKLVRTLDLPKPSKDRPDAPDNNENRCRNLAVSPDGKWLVTMTQREWYRDHEWGRSNSIADGVVDVWELSTGKRVRRLAESGSTFRSGMFTPDGQFILIGVGGIIPADEERGEQEFTGEINLFDPIAGRHVRGFEVPKGPDTAVYRYIGGSVISPDGRTLYVSYNTGEIVAFEVATGKPRRTLTGHRGYVAGLSMSADGKRLISGGQDGIALVWDVALSETANPRKK
jgi:RNA polymerase sigma factor (sigma-70 family)